jgi:hypothetical protein
VFILILNANPKHTGNTHIPLSVILTAEYLFALYVKKTTSSINIVTRLGAEQVGNLGSVPNRDRELTLLHGIHTSSESHSVFRDTQILPS